MSSSSVADHVLFFDTESAVEVGENAGEWVWNVPKTIQVAASEWSIGLHSLIVPPSRNFWLPPTTISYTKNGGEEGRIAIPELYFSNVNELTAQLAARTWPQHYISFTPKLVHNENDLIKIEIEKHNPNAIIKYSLDSTLCKILGFLESTFPYVEKKNQFFLPHSIGLFFSRLRNHLQSGAVCTSWKKRFTNFGNCETESKRRCDLSAW